MCRAFLCERVWCVYACDGSVTVCMYVCVSVLYLQCRETGVCSVLEMYHRLYCRVLLCPSAPMTGRRRASRRGGAAVVWRRAGVPAMLFPLPEHECHDVVAVGRSPEALLAALSYICVSKWPNL